jgi:tetratricopeptide (TPR) repeat protein
MALYRAERYDEALAAYDRALDGLDTGPVHLGRGATLLMLGDRERGRDALEAAVFRAPSLEDAWANLLAITPAAGREPVFARAERWLDAEAVERLRNRYGEAPATAQPSTSMSAS